MRLRAFADSQGAVYIAKPHIMKPTFALNLSHEGIVLLHRTTRGGWTVVGEVALDAADLRDNLSYLRSTAIGLEGKGFGTKLIIPESQILYREVYAPGPGRNERQGQIAAALEGQTPYDVTDLTFDWRGDSDNVEVAIVANETLEEAEEFALEHRFNPISFVTRSDRDGNPWEPFFGRSEYSYTLLGPEADVRDEGAEFGIEQSADAQTLANDQDAAATSSAVENPNIFEADDGLADETNASDKLDAPAFSTRRNADDQPGEPDDIRPISRVSSRMVIGAVAPKSIPVADGSQTDHGSATASPIVAAAPTAPRVKRPAALGPVPTAKTAGSKATKSLRDMFARKAAEVPESKANLPAAKPREVSAATLASQLYQDQDTDKPAASTGATPVGKSSHQLMMAAVALLVLLLLTGLGYVLYSSGFLGSENKQTALTPTEGQIEASAANDTADQVNPEIEVARRAVIPMRPERRSIYEGQVDPEAGKPDTAKPLTELSAQELADIRATGLTAPTAEELVQGGDSPSSDVQIAGIDPDPNNAPTQEELEESEDAQTHELDAATVADAYKATGILLAVDGLSEPDETELRDDIYVAAVDRRLEARDATILPDFNTGPGDDAPRKTASPLGPLIVFDLDAAGLVKATKTGTLNPDGIYVFLGRPEIAPPVKPKTEELLPPNPLRALTPKARPASLKTGDDAIFLQGNLTVTKLRALKAKPRPASAQDLKSDETYAPTEFAVLTSLQPTHRPPEFKKIVERTTIALATAIAVASNEAEGDSEPTPTASLKLPTRASVAKQATIKNVINPSALNLIGVYGTPAKRRALLRLPSGQYVKVEIGDRVDGGRIAAIDVDSLSYVKSGRNRVLKIPQ